MCDGNGRKKSVEVDRPNVLIELKPDFPVVDKLLLDLSTAGIDEVVLQTDVASDMLESALGYDRKGLRLTYKKTKRTFEHIARPLADMDDDVLLIDSGAVTDINLTKMILKFNNATAPVILHTTIYEPQNVLDQSEDTFSCCESQEVFGGHLRQEGIRSDWLCPW